MEQDNILSQEDYEKANRLVAEMRAMKKICAGMTLEEMQNAPFTYQSLLEIVQRRESKEQQK